MPLWFAIAVLIVLILICLELHVINANLGETIRQSAHVAEQVKGLSFGLAEIANRIEERNDRAEQGQS